MIDDLAILVVYVVRSHDDETLLDLHLDRIARHTTVPYRIHAAAPRITARAASVLAARDEVTVWPTPPFDQFGSREHAHHLDALVQHGLAGASSHLATFDLDSFPIADGWHDTFAPRDRNGVAAILRLENGDVVLPHPSCTVLARTFLEQHPFSFSPDSDGTREFRAFLRGSGQSADTGIRLAYELARHNLEWQRVLRSNVNDLHPLIAGIYGNTVFHLGAGARPSLFRRDLATSLTHRLSRPIDRIPVRPGVARRLKRRVLRTVRGPAERRMIAANATAAGTARQWLRDDPDGLFDFLRGLGPPPDRVPSDPDDHRDEVS